MLNNKKSGLKILLFKKLFVYLHCKSKSQKNMEENQFLKHVENSTYTENGAVAVKSTLSTFADQFGLAGNYRGRDLEDVFADMEKLWDDNSTMTMRFIFYLRAVTRKTRVNEDYTTSSVVKGQGSRDEVFKRLLWVAKYHPESFYKNIPFLPVVGSWKDVWQLLFYDVNLGVNAIDHEAMFEVIKVFLKSEINLDLIKKYLPRIRSTRKCKTDWARITNSLAKELAKYLGLSYADYNHLKSSGKAHDFQKAICSGKYDAIEWNKIPGKALNLLANGKFIDKHGLTDEFTKWILSTDKVNFTGYVYELFKKAYENISRGKFVGPLYRKHVLDKQFDNLVEKASTDGAINGNVWCALDTSWSMNALVSNNRNISAYDVCISLGIFFSTLNKGAFHKHVIMFNSESRTMGLHGTFTDMVSQITSSSTAWGSTNFLSVVREIIRVRKNHPEIPLEDYPTTLLVVSDMQFDAGDRDEESNYQEMKKMLSEVFPQEFVDSMKFVWWNCISRVENFPATIDDGGCYFLSGFDGSIIQLLLGGEQKDEITGEKKTPTMEELIETALNQEVLNMVEA